MVWITLNGAISLLISYRVIVLFNPTLETYSIYTTMAGFLGGAVYGFITTIILKNEHILSNRKSMFQVWVFGVFCFAMGRGVGELIVSGSNAIDGGVPYHILYGIGGLIGGAINAYLLFWEINKEINQKKTV